MYVTHVQWIFLRNVSNFFSRSLIRSPNSSPAKSASAGNTTEFHFPRCSNGGGMVGFMSSANPEVKRTLATYVLTEGAFNCTCTRMTDRLSSFWGPVTSTDWCEKNYLYSSYIAEFFNTISNIPCLLLALIGLINALRQRFEKRFSVLHVSNMVLAIGSILYHATLQRVQQQGDETPMVWEMLLYIYILYSPDWHYRSTMPTFLFLYGAAFAVAHAMVRFQIGFKVHYAILCLLCIPRMYKYYIHTKDHRAKRLAKLYLITIVVGILCWVFDHLFCVDESSWYFNPQGHALWHVFMGFNSYFANTFLMFCRAQQLEWNPQVVHVFGIFPYVKIQKPKSQ